MVRTTCCYGQYELDPAIGQAIARGEDVQILPEHLTPIGRNVDKSYKRCSQCGFATEEDFQYCPKCGNVLEK